MQKQLLESKVLTIVDRVLKKHSIEDDLVELKANWPEDHRKAARQVAGHANSAFGQPILWIIGIDEKNFSVQGATPIEVSNWWAKVQRWFSDDCPSPEFLNVKAKDATLTAVLFETDLAPYVVMTEEGGQVKREVPYREANSTESATRRQLLRILSQHVSKPILEIVDCEFIYKQGPRSSNNSGIGYRFEINLYVVQPQDQQFFVIAKRIKVIVISGSFSIPLKNFSVGEDNETINLIGPGRTRIAGSGPLDDTCLSQRVGQPLVLQLKFQSANLSKPLVENIELGYCKAEENEFVWRFSSGED